MSDMRFLLREVMAQRDLRPTAYALAKASRGHIHVSTAHRLLHEGPKRIDFDTLATLCDVLDVHPGDLIEHEPKKRKPKPR